MGYKVAIETTKKEIMERVHEIQAMQVEQADFGRQDSLKEPDTPASPKPVKKLAINRRKLGKSMTMTNTIKPLVRKGKKAK